MSLRLSLTPRFIELFGGAAVTVTVSTDLRSPHKPLKRFCGNRNPHHTQRTMIIYLTRGRLHLTLPHLFRDALLRLIASSNLQYKELTAKT